MAHSMHFPLVEGESRDVQLQRLIAAVDTAKRGWSPNDRCASCVVCVAETTDACRNVIRYNELPHSAGGALHLLLRTMTAETSGLPFRAIKLAPVDVSAAFMDQFPFLVNLPPQRLPYLPFWVPIPGYDRDLTLSGALFLGNNEPAREEQTFSQLRIDRVVNCSTEVKCFFERPDQRSVDMPRDLQYLRLPIKDANEQSLEAALQTAVPFIDSALKGGRRVLVHCAQGLSRSVAVVYGCLIISCGLTLSQAEGCLAGYSVHGSLPRPNDGFRKQLEALSAAVRPDGTCSGKGSVNL